MLQLVPGSRIIMRTLPQLFVLLTILSVCPGEEFKTPVSLQLVKSTLDELRLCGPDIRHVSRLQNPQKLYRPYVRLNVLGSKLVFRRTITDTGGTTKHFFTTHGTVTLRNETSHAFTSTLRYYDQALRFSDQTKPLTDLDDSAVTSTQLDFQPAETEVLELSYISSDDLKKVLDEKLAGKLYGQIVDQYENGTAAVPDRLLIKDTALSLFYTGTGTRDNSGRMSIDVNIPREVHVVVSAPHEKFAGTRIFGIQRRPGLVYRYEFEKGNFVGAEDTMLGTRTRSNDSEIVGFSYYPYCHSSITKKAFHSLILQDEVIVGESRLEEDLKFCAPTCAENHVGVLRYTESSTSVIFCADEYTKPTAPIALNRNDKYYVKTKIRTKKHDANVITLDKDRNLKEFYRIKDQPKPTKYITYTWIPHDGSSVRILDSAQSAILPENTIIEKVVDYVEIAKLDRVYKKFYSDMNERICKGENTDYVVMTLCYRGIKAKARCSKNDRATLQLLQQDQNGIRAVVDTGNFNYSTHVVLEGAVKYDAENGIFYSDKTVLVGLRAIYVTTDIKYDEKIEIAGRGLQDMLREVRSNMLNLIAKGRTNETSVLNIGGTLLVQAESDGTDQRITFTGRFEKVFQEEGSVLYTDIHAKQNGEFRPDLDNIHLSRYLNDQLIESDEKRIGHEIYYERIRDMDSIVKAVITRLIGENRCDANRDKQIRVDVELKTGFYLQGEVFDCRTKSFTVDINESSAIIKEVEGIDESRRSAVFVPIQTQITFDPDVMYIKYPRDIYALRIPENREVIQGNREKISFELVVGKKKRQFSYYVHK